MGWSLSDQRTYILRAMREVSGANDLLVPSGTDYSILDGAINEALVEFYRAVQPAWRSQTVTVTDLLATYRVPRDFMRLDTVVYSTDTEPLDETSRDQLAKDEPSYRTTTAGTPDRWYMRDANYFTLYPAPDVSVATTMALEGYVFPHGVGGTVVTAARATTVVTITTVQAHNLAVGDIVTLYGVTVGTGANLDGAYTVATVPSSTVMTATSGTSATATNTLGVLYYTGGIPPLYAATDFPDLPSPYQVAPAHGAIFRLASGLGRDNQQALDIAKQHLAEFQGMVAQAQKDSLSGLLPSAHIWEL